MLLVVAFRQPCTFRQTLYFFHYKSLLTFRISHYNMSSFSISFNDIGQGDSTVIVSPSDHIIIVDSGSTSQKNTKHSSKQELVESIAESVYTHISKSSFLLIILAHSDSDHINLINIILQYLFTKDNTQRCKVSTKVLSLE